MRVAVFCFVVLVVELVVLGAELKTETVRLSASKIIGCDGGPVPFSKETVRLSASIELEMTGTGAVPFNNETVKLSASIVTGEAWGGAAPFRSDTVRLSASKL